VAILLKPCIQLVIAKYKEVVRKAPQAGAAILAAAVGLRRQDNYLQHLFAWGPDGVVIIVLTCSRPALATRRPGGKGGSAVCARP
jgi:hypothetical protein